MPFFSLIPHAGMPADAASAVEVMLERAGAELLLRYELPDPVDVAWPKPAVPSRAEGLWRSTCFELFLKLDDNERYLEFNFSPSSQWAAYAFTGYRDGMADLGMPVPPAVTRIRAGVDVVLPIAGLSCGEVRLGVSAVIEGVDGAKTYWALAHAPGPPDFHNPACFIATLPAPPPA